MILILMLRYDLLAPNNLYNLYYRYHKKVLNWEGLYIKLKHYLERVIFIGNKNIPPVSCIILYSNLRERRFPDPEYGMY